MHIQELVILGELLLAMIGLAFVSLFISRLCLGFSRWMSGLPNPFHFEDRIWTGFFWRPPDPPKPLESPTPVRVSPEQEAYYDRISAMPKLGRWWFDKVALAILSPWPPEWGPVIERKMEEMQAGRWAPECDPEGARRLAREHKAMFLCWDWSAAFLLRPDGLILLVLCEDDVETVEEAESGWALFALARACAIHPELRPMLPPRSAGAIDCGACEGTGLMPVGDGRPLSCMICSRLGWVIPATAAQDGA